MRDLVVGVVTDFAGLAIGIAIGVWIAHRRPSADENWRRALARIYAHERTLAHEAVMASLTGDQKRAEVALMGLEILRGEQRILEGMLIAPALVLPTSISKD